MSTSSSTSMPQSNALLEKYIATLTEKEYQGYLIAKSHLGSSFDLEKSLGFIEWKKTNPLTTSHPPSSSEPYNP